MGRCITLEGCPVHFRGIRVQCLWVRVPGHLLRELGVWERSKQLCLGKIVCGSIFHSLLSLKTLDSESAAVFDLPGTC